MLGLQSKYIDMGIVNRIKYDLEGFYRDYTPVALQWQVTRLVNYPKYKLRKDIIAYLEKMESNDTEKQAIKNFIKGNVGYLFPYSYTKKYNAQSIKVFDDESGMKYVLHQNKKMYFPKNWSKRQIQEYYNRLLTEMDENSPHLYETEKFQVNNGDVLADCGGAEGIFTLTNIDKISKAYIFECEDYWISVLEKTFEPWKEKVNVVKKYISDISTEESITLDDFLKGSKLDFVKADIEGAEIKLLAGAKHTIRSNSNLRMVLCTYHNVNDGSDINEVLMKEGFQTEFSKGYMIYVYDENIAPPYLRRGVIRATK
ncbi:MAG TPA: FkbM family methyltransferase [Arachidicoccus sp.]